MHALNHEEERLIEEIEALDAYSQDNQFIGRLTGYLPTAAEGELGEETGSYDTVRSDGTVVGERRVRIDGTGTPIQATIVVPVSSLQIDLRGRRVTVPLTVAQIESMPHHDPRRPDRIELP